MNARFSIPVFLAAWSMQSAVMAAPTPEQMQALVKSRPELDEITWKDPARGAPLKVRIIQAAGQTLTVEKLLPSGMTVRTIPLSDLAGIEFTFTPRETALHVPAVASIPPLRVYWELRQGTVRIPGSNAGLTGIALAKSLRLSGQPAELEEAAKILDQVRAQDPQDSHVAAARAEQATLDFSRAVKAGKTEETDKLAWKITEEADNPEGMLAATAYLADRHFKQLKETEEENPRWMEDDEVKPVRDRLYHLAVDFSLYPSLFLGTHEAESAAGLKRAAEIYQFTGGTLLAKNVLEDLAALYPESEPAVQTAPLLARLTKLEAEGKLSEATEEPREEKSGESAEDDTPKPAPGTPAPTKRYNIFGD